MRLNFATKKRIIIIYYGKFLKMFAEIFGDFWRFFCKKAFSGVSANTRLTLTMKPHRHPAPRSVRGASVEAAETIISLTAFRREPQPYCVWGARLLPSHWK